MIIVVGAGPAGLATAYYLKKHGLPYRILEKHTVGYTWQKQYDSLSLHTLKAVSALPGLPMPEHYPRFPSAGQHLAYLQEYARHFGLNIEEHTEVQNALYDGGWILETNRGVLRADILIAATGIWSTPHRPEFTGEERFSGRVIHARDYQNPASFLGQRVLVVGVGNSGAEIAVELAQNDVETGLAVRSGVDFVPYPDSALLVRAAAWFFRHAPRPVGEWVLSWFRRDFSHLGLRPAAETHLDAYPVVGFELPEAVAEGKVTVYQQGVDRFTEDGVQLDDGQEVPVDAVILATGYRPTLQFVADELDFSDDGAPILENSRSTRHPYLYCIGFDYPGTEGWLQAIGRVARSAVSAVAEAPHQLDQKVLRIPQ